MICPICKEETDCPINFHGLLICEECRDDEEVRIAVDIQDCEERGL